MLANSSALNESIKPWVTEGLSSSSRFQIAGWFLWLTLLTTVTYTVITKEERSVTVAYRSAAYNWVAGKPLYNMTGRGFLYLPQAALTFSPWAFLPHTASEILWRWFIIAVLGFGVVRMTTLVGGDGHWFFVVSFCATVMAWGCARNGQSTLLITGLMIFAAADLSERHWWRAAVLLAVAFAVKPLAIVLLLLASAIYPQVSWRLAISLIVVAILPFLTQSPSYVWSQYTACVESLSVTFRLGEDENWAQLFGLLNVAGIAVASSTRNFIRIVAAIATFLLCYSAARKLSPPRAAYYIFSLSACYIMLFNSRTEGNTYAMVGPVYGILLAEAIFSLQSRWGIRLMVTAVVFSVLNYDLAILFTSRSNAIWISPLVCTAVTSYIVKHVIEEIRRSSLNKKILYSRY